MTKKIIKIITEAMYDSKYEALTKGYQDEVDKVVSAIEQIIQDQFIAGYNACISDFNLEAKGGER